MSNEHCLVFARGATGLFPDPAQQFFFALPFFFAALCYGCIASAALLRGRTNAACFLFCIIAAALRALFAFAGRLRTISHQSLPLG